MKKVYKFGPNKKWELVIFWHKKDITLIRLQFVKYGINLLIPRTMEVPHDHPWSFWTFPLWPTGYTELVLNNEGELDFVHNPGFRWTKKSHNHSHILVGPGKPKHYNKDDISKLNFFSGWIFTIMKREKKVQPGSFWLKKDQIPPNLDVSNVITKGDYIYVPPEYLVGKNNE